MACDVKAKTRAKREAATNTLYVREAYKIFKKNYKTVGEEGMLAMYHLLAKPMKRAEYFCAANSENPEDFHHYALSVPLYTHFTSPIRRYADIMVHRLLSATLGKLVRKILFVMTQKF